MYIVYLQCCYSQRSVFTPIILVHFFQQHYFWQPSFLVRRLWSVNICMCIQKFLNLLLFLIFFYTSAGNEYHQYDFFVYPKETQVRRGILSRAWKASVDFLLSNQDSASQEQPFSPPSTEDMVKDCLHFYLEPFKDCLLNNAGYQSNFSISEFVRQVKLLFMQHHTPVVQYSLPTHDVVTVRNMNQVILFCKLQIYYRDGVIKKGDKNGTGL